MAKTRTSWKAGDTPNAKRKTRGGGRPPEVARKALRDLLTTPLKNKEGTSIRDLCIDGLRAAVKARDDAKNPTPASMRAIELVLQYTDGKPEDLLKVHMKTSSEVLFITDEKLKKQKIAELRKKAGI